MIPEFISSYQMKKKKKFISSKVPKYDKWISPVEIFSLLINKNDILIGAYQGNILHRVYRECFANVR